MWLTHVRLQPSYFYKLLIILITLSTLLMLFMAPVPHGVRFGLVFITLFYGAIIFQKHGCMGSPAAVESMNWINPREWQLNGRQGESWVGYLKGDSLITPWLMVLRFKVRNRWLPVTLVLFRDTVGQNDFRRLLVTLRLDR